MERNDLHSWAAMALRTTVARCIRALIAEIEREARGELRLADKLRAQAKATGWA